MREHQLAPPHGSTSKHWRIGRGTGSGSGTTAGAGTKGQNARRGLTIRPGFEGGQLPLIKRLPRQRGFRPPFRVEFQPVNIAALEEKFPAHAEITPAALQKAGLIRDAKQPVKILGAGTLKKSLTVRAHKFSASAKTAIEHAQGITHEIPSAKKQDAAATA